MSFLSKFIPPARRGEKCVERGRAAELRGDFAAAEAHFRDGAEAFDAHLTSRGQRGRDVRPSHRVLAGIAYTRTGRNQDALAVLGPVLKSGDIPDAYLHAGYAAAKLGDGERAAGYWAAYPDWAEERLLGRVLREQAAALRLGGDPQAACEAVARAVLAQDRENARRRPMSRGRKQVPSNRGY